MLCVLPHFHAFVFPSSACDLVDSVAPMPVRSVQINVISAISGKDLFPQMPELSLIGLRV